MFYEKLAEAKQDKKRSKMRDRLLTGAGAVAGGVGGYKVIDPLATRYVSDRQNANAIDAVGDSFVALGRKWAGEIDEDTLLNEKARISDRMRKMNRRAELQGKGARGLATLLGAGVAGYGTKKLLDRYNARKQERN